MISFLLSLALGLAQAELLEVVDMEFTSPTTAPSCRLLTHRMLEREKVLREIAHNFNYEEVSNTLIQNKYFFDTHVWIDEVVQVKLAVSIPNHLSSAIEQDGKENLVFEIHGRGITWKSLLSQLPDDFDLKISSGEGLVFITYPIYLSEFCFGAPKPPSLSLKHLF